MSFTGDAHDALKTLITRATTDLDFRRKLLSDPHRAILEATGTAPKIRVRFVEKDPAVDLLIVLPDYLPDGPELQPDELEAVAGGTNWCEFSCTVTSEGDPEP